MSKFIGHGRYRTESYPERNPSTSGFLVRAVGIDTMAEQVTVLSQATIAAAAMLPPIPKNNSGDFLQVTFPSWVQGDVLRITWGAGAILELGNSSLGILAPLVNTGSGFKYLDNASQFAMSSLPTGTAGASNNVCAFVPLAVTSPPVVRLGLALWDPDGGQIVLPGPTLNYADLSLGSVWLQAEAISATAFFQIPTSVLRDPPFPTS